MSISRIARFMGARRFWEGRYVDLWSIPHVISGALIAFALIRLGFGFWSGLALVAALASGWELFERFTTLAKTEYPSNSLMNIVFAVLGYLLFRWFAVLNARAMRVGVSYVLLAAFVVLVLFGWASYVRYRKL